MTKADRERAIACLGHAIELCNHLQIKNMN